MGGIASNPIYIRLSATAMRGIIERVTPRTWKRDKARLLEMLKG